MTTPKLFLLSVLVTVCVLLAFFYAHRPERRSAPVTLRSVGDGLFVTEQLKPENIGDLRRHAIQTIVDIRPDGEVSDQPSSREMMQVANAAGMKFHYIPVSHGPIPADAVRKLNDVLSSGSSGRVVLYCRTGNRAVRTYALVAASCPGGPNAETILATVHHAGFSADDLQDDINRRIANRDAVPTTSPP